MFTRQELNILRSSLRSWDGPYGSEQKLNSIEFDRDQVEKVIANELALRFEAILQDYFEMETKTPTKYCY